MIKLTIIPLIFCVSCVTSMVKRPAADIVKKVAIVSVYSNPAIYDLDGKGEESGSGLGSFMGTKVIHQVVNKNTGAGLVDYGLKTFAKSLSSVDGWKVVDTKKVIKHPEYKKFVTEQNKRLKKEEGIMHSANESNYQVATGMVRYWLPNYANDDSTKHLQKLAKALKVDAVAVINFDFAYKGSNSFGGNGSAKAAVGTSVRMVTREGKYAVNTINSTSGMRFNSSSTVAMVMGHVKYDKVTEKLYTETIDTTAKHYKNKIDEGLKLEQE